jgi:hypothetical protein
MRFSAVGCRSFWLMRKPKTRSRQTVGIEISFAGATTRHPVFNAAVASDRQAMCSDAPLRGRCTSWLSSRRLGLCCFSLAPREARSPLLAASFFLSMTATSPTGHFSTFSPVRSLPLWMGADIGQPIGSSFKRTRLRRPRRPGGSRSISRPNDRSTEPEYGLGPVGSRSLRQERQRTYGSTPTRCIASVMNGALPLAVLNCETSRRDRE